MAVNWISKQQEVIDSRSWNLLVSVAAGSGKTAVLVERIIQMMSEGDRPLDIGQLLVMTFTNATVIEMRERIGAVMEQRLKKCPEGERPWLQVALVPQAQIITTDSFCLDTIRSHYNSLDIDSAFRTGDEGGLSLLRGDCMGGMLENCYDEADTEFARFVEHFSRGKSGRGIEDVILQAWQFSQSYPWPGEWLASCQKELGEESILEMEESPWTVFPMEDVVRQMEEPSGQLGKAVQVCLEENGPLVYESMLIGDRSKIEAIERVVATGSFEALYNNFQNMSFGRLASIRSEDIDGDRKASVSVYRDWVKKAVAKCRELYGQQSSEEVVESTRGTRTVIRELLELTGMFDQAYRDTKRERNVLDLNDLEHPMPEILYEREEIGDEEETAPRRPSQVADELSWQYEEILVDECQSSNYIQEALITGISRERSGHLSMFMVRGVKQSIYRFHLAKSELFMDKYETYSRERGPRQMTELQQNSRGRESMLTSVNDAFCRIMTKNLGGVTHTPETTLRPGAKFEGVSGRTVLNPEADTGESGSREAAPVSLKAGTLAELLPMDMGADTLRQPDEDSLDYTVEELEARLIAGRIRQPVSED